MGAGETAPEGTSGPADGRGELAWTVGLADGGAASAQGGVRTSTLASPGAGFTVAMGDGLGGSVAAGVGSGVGAGVAFDPRLEGFEVAAAVGSGAAVEAGVARAHGAACA